MVTYEPNQAVISRTTPRGVPQVHVQYFGISAVRGWVSQTQHEPLVDVASKRAPTANLGKKMKSEFDVAIQEAAEALRMTHKERKLKFIFNFDPPPPPPQESPSSGIKMEDSKIVVVTAAESAGTREVLEGVGSDAKPHRKQRGELKRLTRGRSRRISSTDYPPLQKRTRNKTLSPGVPSQTRLRLHSGSEKRHCRRRKEGGGSEEDLVVSVRVNGLGSPPGTRPNLLVGQSPVKMDSFAVSVHTVLNLARSECTSARPPNGLAVPPPGKRGRGRPRKVSSSSSGKNFCRAPILRTREKRVGRVRATDEPCEGRARSEPLVGGAPPVKRLAMMDPDSESGSEASGVSIASAILMTPPSSGTEAAVEDERRGGGRGRAVEDSTNTHVVEEEEEIEVPKGKRRKLKHNAKVQARTKPSAGDLNFRDGECAICDARDANLLVCQGHCLQAFHVDCLGLMRAPKFQFVCDECQMVPRGCFVCSGSHGPLERCAKPKCSKFYHRSCITDDRLFVFDSVKAKFTCPLHSCAKCVCSELEPVPVAPRGSTLVQCIKCPLALHKPHCLIAGCTLLSSTQMVCYLHIRIETETNLYKHLNMDTCLECGTSGSLYCCDFCSSAYHEDCMEEHHKPAVVEEGGGAVDQGREKWICPACRDHDLPTYESVVLCKFGKWR